jgi:hypothetical protein
MIMYCQAASMEVRHLSTVNKKTNPPHTQRVCFFTDAVAPADDAAVAAGVPDAGDAYASHDVLDADAGEVSADAGAD